MTFLSALEHFLCTLPTLFHAQIVLLVVIGAEFTCIRMLSSGMILIPYCDSRLVCLWYRWHFSSVRVRNANPRNCSSHYSQWFIRRTTTAQAIVAILSLSWLLTVKIRSRINDRYVWSMVHVLARASKGFHLDLHAPDSSNGAHYPSYIRKCIKLRSVNCYKNWFLWSLYLRRHRLNLFSEDTGIISTPMPAIESINR